MAAPRLSPSPLWAAKPPHAYAPLPGEGGCPLWAPPTSDEDHCLSPYLLPQAECLSSWASKHPPFPVRPPRITGWKSSCPYLSICPQLVCAGVFTTNSTVQLLTRSLGTPLLQVGAIKPCNLYPTSTDCPWSSELSGGKPGAFCKADITRCSTQFFFFLLPC